MKKLISNILCIGLLFSLSISAFAAETNNTILTYDNAASYEISIPSESSINKNTGSGTIVLSVTDTNLADGMTVAVAVSSDNFVFGEEGEDDEGNSYKGMWYLVNTKDSSDKLKYMIKTDDREDYLSSGDVVFETDVPTDWNLYIQLGENAKVGRYTDTLTFTSEIKEDLYSIEYSEDSYFDFSAIDEDTFSAVLKEEHRDLIDNEGIVATTFFVDIGGQYVEVSENITSGEGYEIIFDYFVDGEYYVYLSAQNDNDDLYMLEGFVTINKN